jgi:hypothetical protein
MCSFYMRKLRVQLFCAYISGLYFTGVRLLAQKLRIEHWWNWPQVSLVLYCRDTFQIFIAVDNEIKGKNKEIIPQPFQTHWTLAGFYLNLVASKFVYLIDSWSLLGGKFMF